MCEASLAEKLRSLGSQEVDLIVRIRAAPSEYISKLEQMGLRVRRQFTLLKAVAVRGKAQDALKLWDEPWVEAVEEDKTVTIF
ncbi:MAG: hypothetical protein DRI61_05530 [Chloroflexi bacterium]|nr:MAG: hypothetical protein DRI61_05530 [Chloroflexota bacterium]HDN79765.1 hypothetical protein [Chloroflexota bacterium]